MGQTLLKNISELLHCDLQGSPAWHGVIDAQEASDLLKSESSFTYLLRQDSLKDDLYWISFVNANGNVCHKPFTYHNSTSNWFYMNHGGDVPAEAKLFDSLSEMIHFYALRCSQKESTIYLS